MESPSFKITNWSPNLEEQEREDLVSPFEDHILSLKLGFRFLELLIDVSSNEDLNLRIKHVVDDVRLELDSFLDRPTDGLRYLILDHEYTNLQEKMSNVIIKPETRESDVVFPKLYSWNPFLKRTSDFILESFEDLSSNIDLIAPWVKEIRDIRDKVMCLQALLKYVADEEVRITEANEKFLTPLVAFLEKSACLIYSCLVVKMDGEMMLEMKRKLSDLSENSNAQEIYMAILRASELNIATYNPVARVFYHPLARIFYYPLGREFYLLYNLMKLLDINAMNYLSQELHDKLKFLETFIRDLPRELRLEKLNYFVKSIEKVTCKAIPILYSCYDKDLKEDMVKEVNGALSEVIDQINDIQAEVNVITLYDYPKTNGLGFMDLLLKHLKELLNCRPELIEMLKSQIEILHGDFEFLRGFLKKIKEQRNEYKELGDLWIHIIGLAYQVEYIIDFYLVKCTSHSRIMLSLTKVLEDTELIRSQVTKIYDKEKYHTRAINVAKTFSRVSSQAIGIEIDEVVGLMDEVEKIKECLIGGTKQRDVVSIVGLPGLGKTTMAMKMYEDPLLIEHFDVRAWCTVSQTFRTRELLLTILSDIGGTTEDMNDESLAEKLYKSLKGRRYLIVLDDLWNIEAWDALVRSLPDDGKHSRIIVTSRIQSVVSQTKVGSKVHLLRGVSDDEGWELFEKKLRQKESLSQEFEEVGRQIVESCKRLPLSIVVIAALLSKMERSVDMWYQVAENLSSHIFSDSESPCKAILELSYNHLPDHLKSCFLYFGAFAEDEQIPVWKLKWLWIAEGFVQNTEAKSLEDAAEEYLMDLISRSLVTASKERSCGGVKACRVHDLLRDFCLEKAKEESFLQVIHLNDEFEFSRAYDQRRLKFYLDSGSGKTIPFGCSVRSVLYTASAYTYLFGDYLSFISKNFKLVRVLDLGNIDMSEYFSGIGLLIHLRYLAVTADITSIPSSISNLWNLQTFIVKAYSNYDLRRVDVADFLWDMVNLRHVHINYGVSFDLHANRLENSLLDNLETLSTPCLCYGEDAENLLRRLPKLRKLACMYYLCQDNTKSHQFPLLNFLDQLLSLKVTFNSKWVRLEKYEFNFPSNLKKLTLSKFALEWYEISKIGRTLPNLEVLKLNYSPKGSDDSWCVDDGDFPKLKYLKLIHQHNFREWNASDDSFPILEKLVLENCWMLKEIPSCFGEIPTLQMIRVNDCLPSVDDSARRIQKEQLEELQNYELKVYIYPRQHEFY